MPKAVQFKLLWKQDFVGRYFIVGADVEEVFYSTFKKDIISWVTITIKEKKTL